MSMSIAGLPASGLSSNRPDRSAASTAPNLKIYVALAGAAVVRLWIMPMTASLWLDETTTYWTACKGMSAAISRSQFWPGQNVLYSLIAALALRLGGNSEFALRFPSLLAALATIWLLFRLGTRLLDRETGLLAVVVFVSLQEMSETAANARPYAIALLLVVGSMLQLVRWLDTGRARNLLGYVILTAAIPYFHYLFATVFVVHTAYALYRSRGEVRVRLARLVAAVAMVGILLSPLIWNAIHGNHISAASSFLPTPDFERFVSSLMPAVLGAGIFAGLLLGYVWFRQVSAGERLEASPETALLLICWLVIPIVACFTVSRLTGFKIFVSRYYLPAFPALALLVAWGIRSLLPGKIRVCVAGGIVAAALLSFGTHHFWVNPHLEDWRAAAQTIRAAGVDGNTPVLVRTGLIETAKPTWSLDLDRDSPLLAPLSRYPIPGRIILVPALLNDDSVRYMNEVSSQILEPASEFLCVTRDVGDAFQPWLSGRFSGKGFAVSKMGHADGVSVFRFRRLAASSRSNLPSNAP
ncbi:MAG: glycosyltransferase family 39 protein [Terriglobales bacterium]